MKIVEVSVKAVGMSPTQKLNLANHIYNQLNGNRTFAALFPTVATLFTFIGVLSTALTNQVKGNKTSTAAVKKALHNVMRTLKAQAACVEYLSDDDETIAITSGFSIKITGARTSHSLKVAHGLLSGDMDLKVKKMLHAAYKFQYSEDPATATSWVDAGEGTLVNMTVHGLTPGKLYWFRVAYIIKNVRGNYGSPVSLRAL
ncbi:MAG: fibronectin type III domain-containing protein [Bacteroidia bacterium]